VNEKLRKQRWKEWWEKEGIKSDTFNFIGREKSFKKPKQSVELSEFIGIILGDGGITRRQVTITLNREEEKEYGQYISNLAMKLFGVPMGIHKRRNENANSYSLSRTGIVDYLVDDLGMKIGNKVVQQVDVPRWIKNNNHYSLSCVRGLMDTDGSIFKHRYRVGGKMYMYKKMQYSSRSRPLLIFLKSVLKCNGIKSRLARNNSVFIDEQVSVDKYFDIVGSNNPKHLKRYKN
jgi:hypothetical protein